MKMSLVLGLIGLALPVAAQAEPVRGHDFDLLTVSVPPGRTALVTAENMTEPNPPTNPLAWVSIQISGLQRIQVPHVSTVTQSIRLRPGTHSLRVDCSNDHGLTQKYCVFTSVLVR